MRKLFPVTSVLALCLLVLASCQKEVDFGSIPDTGGNPVTPPAATGSFKAKVNGVQFSSTNASASIFRGLIAIIAFKDKKFFEIVINDTVPQTYVMDQNSVTVLAYVDSTDANISPLTTDQGGDTSKAYGKVTITSIDKVRKVITGTFTSKVYRDDDQKQRTITEGSFSVPYSDGLPIAKGTDTFKVKVDAADWTAKSITALISGNLLVINGSEQNLTKVVTFQLPQDITPGTYDLDFTGNYIGLYLPDGQTPYPAAGKITVLEKNTTTRRIRANFNYKATSLTGSASFQLTNGYLSVQY